MATVLAVGVGVAAAAFFVRQAQLKPWDHKLTITVRVAPVWSPFDGQEEAVH